MPEYKCIKCSYETDRRLNYETHMKSKKHFKLSNKCFCCHKQFKYPSELKRHGHCTKIINANTTNGTINDSVKSVLLQESDNANVLVGDHSKIIHINVHNYSGDKRKFIWQLTSDATICFDSPEMQALLNLEFQDLYEKLQLCQSDLQRIKQEIIDNHSDRFLSYVNNTPYSGYTKIEKKKVDYNSDSDSYDEDSDNEYEKPVASYKLNSSDNEILFYYKKIINDFDDLISKAYDSEDPKNIIQPKIYSHKDVENILFRLCPELLTEKSKNYILGEYMNNDKDHNSKVASNLLNNLLIRSIDRIINDIRKKSQKNVVSSEDDVYYKSKNLKSNKLAQLTNNILSITFGNIKNVVDIGNEMFPEVNFGFNSIDMEYIKSKLSLIIPDISP